MKKLLRSGLCKILLLAGVLCVFASCADKYPVTFHLEASEGEPDKMTFAYEHQGKAIKFQKAAFIGSRDIESYRLIRNFEGPVGIGFYLTPAGTIRYRGLFHDSHGKLVLPVVNGNPKGLFKIGGVFRPIMPIYEGLTEEEIKMIRKVYEPHKEEQEFEKERKAKTATKIEKLS